MKKCAFQYKIVRTMTASRAKIDPLQTFSIGVPGSEETIHAMQGDQQYAVELEESQARGLRDLSNE